MVWKHSCSSTSSGVSISCLALWKEAVFVGVDRIITCLDLSNGREIYIMCEHVDTIVWVDVVEDKYLCTATSSTLKAHSLWYQTNMAVPVCLLDPETTSKYFKFVYIYWELFDFVVQGTFLLITIIQRFGFSYDNIVPPSSYSYFQDVSVRLQSFSSFTSTSGEFTYVQELVIALAICSFLMLLFLFHKALQLKVFENPESILRLFWTAAVYSVQIIVGPIMLPLLQVLLEVFACARDEDGVLRLERDDSIICNSRSHLALLIPAAIFLVILIYISFRLNRVDNDLGATEIRWKNIFDYRGDLVRYSHIAHS